METTRRDPTKAEEPTPILATNGKGIAHVVNDLSNPPQMDFKSLASANFATPAAGAAVAGL